MSYFTSISRQNEFETNSDSVIPLFSVTYFLAISISILSCLRYCVVLKKMSNKHVYVSLGMSLSLQFVSTGWTVSGRRCGWLRSAPSLPVWPCWPALDCCCSAGCRLP